MRNVIHSVHVKVPPCMQSRMWHGRSVHCLLWLFDWLLYWLLIVRLRVEAEMVGHDPYCYWDANFPTRSFDVYVNNYYGHWDFPGPCPEFPGHLISFLLGWARGLTHLSVQKFWMLFGLYCTRCWDSEQSFRTRVPLQYVARRLSNDSHPNTLTCVLVQQTWWSSWFSQIWTYRVLREAHPGFFTTSDILLREADHEYCYDLRCASADALCGVRSELKSTVSQSVVTTSWTASKRGREHGNAIKLVLRSLSQSTVTLELTRMSMIELWLDTYHES